VRRILNVYVIYCNANSHVYSYKDVWNIAVVSKSKSTERGSLELPLLLNVKSKSKVHCFAGTEALYRPYGP